MAQTPEAPMPVFQMGSGSYRHNKVPKRKVQVRKKPVPLENLLLPYFKDINPIYVKRMIQKYQAEPIVFDLQNKTHPAEIKMMLSRKPDESDIYYAALRQIRYFKGTFMEWQIYLQKLAMDYSKFNSSQNFNFESKSNICSPFDKRIPAVAQHIFYYNQRYRWFLKRAITRWIAKRASKRIIGADSDILTLDSIAPKDQISVLCTATRTIYVFSGQTLLKTVLSSLETQVEAIPRPRQPMNPYTNLPFSYGQMNELYYEILRWCGANRKPVPALLTLYKEASFIPTMMYRTNHNYVHYKAGKNYFIRDEADNEFFLETIKEVLDAYEPVADAQERLILIGFDRKMERWIATGNDQHIIKLWRQLVADYWYYKQTEIFPRVTWNSEDAVMKDVKTLIQASIPNMPIRRRRYL